VNTVAVERGGELYHPAHLSKDQDIVVTPGDRICVRTPGGGGYGDPQRREPAAVARDVGRGYYTAQQASERFGVVLDAQGGVDAAATVARRAATTRRAAE
jgi:N-methylhydantoinase B